MSEEQQMQKYIGVKLIHAIPMTRAAYNVLRGWDLPEDEEGSDKGFLVEYMDGGQPNHKDYAGYISWSPDEVFQNAYKETQGLNFGLAIEAMKKGLKVVRKGWNGNGINIFIVDRSVGIVDKTDTDFSIQRHIVIDTTGLKTDNPDAPKSIVPWLASQTDTLAEDWMVVN